MHDKQTLLDLAARFREFALETAQDDYAARMLRAARELEIQAAAQCQNQPTQRKTRIA